MGDATGSQCSEQRIGVVWDNLNTRQAAIGLAAEFWWKTHGWKTRGLSPLFASSFLKWQIFVMLYRTNPPEWASAGSVHSLPHIQVLFCWVGITTVLLIATNSALRWFTHADTWLSDGAMKRISGCHQHNSDRRSHVRKRLSGVAV